MGTISKDRCTQGTLYIILTCLIMVGVSVIPMMIPASLQTTFDSDKRPEQSLYSVSITCDRCDSEIKVNDGQAVTHAFDATVTNTGLRADGYDLVFLNTKEWTVNIDPPSISLLPGQSQTINVTVYIPGTVTDMTRGQTDLIVQSTSTGCSNCDDVTVTTTVRSPSITIDDVQMDPEVPKDGEKTVLSVIVRNDGGVPSVGTTIGIDIDGDTMDGNIPVGDLSPDEHKVIEFEWTPGRGEHTVKAYVSSAYGSIHDPEREAHVNVEGAITPSTTGPYIAVLIMVILVVVAVLMKARSGPKRKSKKG